MNILKVSLNSLPTVVSCLEVHERQAPQGASEMQCMIYKNLLKVTCNVTPYKMIIYQLHNIKSKINFRVATPLGIKKRRKNPRLFTNHKIMSLTSHLVITPPPPPLTHPRWH